VCDHYDNRGMTDHPWAGAAYVESSPLETTAQNVAAGEEQQQEVINEAPVARTAPPTSAARTAPTAPVPRTAPSAQVAYFVPASAPTAPSFPASAPTPPSFPASAPVFHPEPPAEVERPLPRSSAALMPSRVRLDRRAATKGWRGTVRRASFGVISPRAGVDEVEEAKDRRAVNSQWSCGKTVVVANPKGGAGKSPTVLGIAATFGELRGGGATVAWDNNETLGTLGIRSDPGRLPNTAVDLLANLEMFERIDARRGALGAFLRHQESGQFDVLVSDEDPKRMSEIGREEYLRIHWVLQRWYDAIVVDTGNNPRAANFLAAIESADMLVIPVRWTADVVVSAGRLIDQLRASGYEDLVSRAVTVVTGAAPPRDQSAEQTDEWRRWYAEQTAAVVSIPYDRHLAVGDAIVYGDLAASTRRAYLRLAAEVVRGFTEKEANDALRARKAASHEGI
jgi:MinD-like ATPase involved in chromosome partitioning or flagellar assembly